MHESLAARMRKHIQMAEFMGLKEAESTLLLKEAVAAIDEFNEIQSEDRHNLDLAEEEIERLEAQSPKWSPEWISVKDRLPEDYIMVFTYDNRGAILAGMRIRTEKGGEWLRDARYGSVVTHWLPFPPDPNGKTIWGKGSVLGCAGSW